MKENYNQPKKLQKEIEKVTKSHFKDSSEIFNVDTQREELNPKESDKPDLNEELFKEINPMGLLLGDLKKKLENEIEEQEAALEELEGKSEDGSYKTFIEETKKVILSKRWWISKIDDVLLDRDVEDLRKINPSLN